MTSAKRAKILIADCLLGSLSFVALFFSVDGSAVAARSPEECPIEQGTFLWFTFVAMFSVLLNFAPRSLECRLARRTFIQEESGQRERQLWRQRFRDVAFWIISSGLSCIHLLIITAFLANLSQADEAKWLFTFGIVLVRKLLIVPLLACLFSGLGTELSLHTGEIRPPKKLGLDLQLSDEGHEQNEQNEQNEEPADGKKGEECEEGDEIQEWHEEGQGGQGGEGSGAGNDRRVWFEKVQELAGAGVAM